MSDQRMGTSTVCLTVDTLPHGHREPTPPPATHWDVPAADPHPQRAKGGGSGVLRLLAAELAVGGPVRPRRLRTQPLDLVLLVVGEVALVPEPPRLALVGEDVRRDPVEEPAVVAHDHGAAGEVQQR